MKMAHLNQAWRCAIFVAALAMPVLATAQTTGSTAPEVDPLLDSLTEAIGGDAPDLAGKDQLTIDAIEFRVKGSTDQAWLRSQLLIAAGTSYSPVDWQTLASRQQAFLSASKLFYQVKVYVLPSGTAGHFKAIVQVDDGYFYAYNVWPWDVTIGFKHLLNGPEQLNATLGLNTQALEWLHPVVSGTPFGYQLSVGHAFSRHPAGWLEDGFQAGAKAFLNAGPGFRVGLQANFRYWTLPASSWLEPSLSAASIAQTQSGLGLTGPGSAFQPGLFLEIWPLYQFQRPVGWHAESAFGAILPGTGGTAGWYSDSRLVLFLQPIDQFRLHGSFELHGRIGAVSAVLYQDTAAYRSPELLPAAAWFGRGTLQLTLPDLWQVSLGFCMLSFNPLAYLETAQSLGSLGDWQWQTQHWSAGGGLALGLSMPVNLYFTFGIKCSIAPSLAPGFLFSVSTDLY